MTRQAVLAAWLVAMGAFQPAPVRAHEDEKAKPDFHAGKCEGNLDEDCFHEEIGKLTSDLQDKHKKYHPVVERIGKWLDQVHHKFHGIREQKVKEGTQLPVTRGELDSFGGAVDKRASLSEAYIEYRRDDDNPQSVERVKKLKAEYERLSESLTAGTEAEKSLIAVFQEVAKPRGGRWGREGRHSRDNPFSDVFEDIAEQIGKGRPEEAAKQAGQIIAVDPRSAEAYSLRAAANYDLKDYNAAVADARTALRLNPEDPTAAAVLKFAESRGGGSGGGVDSSVGSGAAGEGFSGGGLAARDSLTAPGPSAGQSDGLIHQAKSALFMKDFKASLDYSGRAIELNPRNAQAYNLRATAYSRTGQFDKALKDAVAGLAFDPKNGVLLKTKAHVLNKMGQYREALAAANAALEADPRDALAYRLRGEALAGMGDRDGALESLRNAARFDPAYGPLHQAAVQLPENSDILLLFAEGPAAVAPAATRAASSRNRRFTAVAASSLIGGLLVALGLIHIFKDPLKKGLTSVFTKVAAGVSHSSSRRTARRGLPSILRGQYTVSREIGSGGMGMVYEGFDTSLERRVAIKRMRDELRRNPRERERFVTEARLVAGLHHPHIVDIYSIVEEGSEVYLIFEYVAGRTVHEIISQRGKLTFGEAMAIFRGICSALEYAHGRGVIHRDLKPSNVMITEDGYVKVMDFGIARAAKDLASRHAMTNTVVGTPPYMAPEQEQGHVRKESDVYSLAVCLYEMLTGSMPFNGSGGGMFMNKYQRNYVAASHLAEGLPQGIDEVLSRAFDPDPDRRFHGAKELLSALDALNSVKAKA